MRSVPTEGRASWTRRVEDIGIAKDAKYESVREETGAAAGDDRAPRNAQLSGDAATPLGWQRSSSAFARPSEQRRDPPTKLMIRNVAALLIGGIVTAIGLSLAATRLLSRLLFGVEARDPATIAMSEALIAAVSPAADLLAAGRATRVNHMVALRQKQVYDGMRSECFNFGIARIGFPASLSDLPSRLRPTRRIITCIVRNSDQTTNSQNWRSRSTDNGNNETCGGELPSPQTVPLILRRETGLSRERSRN
jgi:hypothetical protein